MAPKNKKTKKPTPKKIKKRKEQKSESDIIFDSNLGKTDALFIDNPAETQDKQVGPDIEQALEDSMKQ